MREPRLNPQRHTPLHWTNWSQRNERLAFNLAVEDPALVLERAAAKALRLTGAHDCITFTCMGDNTTFRKNHEDVRIMALIREHLTETIGEPSESDCIRFAFRAAERELKGKPKPRSPRKQ